MKYETLKPFIAHGVQLSGTSGDQAYGRCPFTGKDDKFYVNVKTLCWDSKTAGLSGNLFKFLELRAKEYTKNLTPDLAKKLAANRKLPISAFQPWGLGWNGKAYTLPIRNHKGFVQDIRMFRLGQHPLSTPGCSTGLLGAHSLPKSSGQPVYLCEGEWDTIALSWLLWRLEKSGIVVGVPGASTFKQEWVSWFERKKVFALYDNDAAGENGEQVYQKRLTGVAQSLAYLHWPGNLPQKYDVRDWVAECAIKRKKPRECWKVLSSSFKATPRPLSHGQPEQPAQPVAVQPASQWDGRKVSLEDVFEVFKKWLYLKNTDAIEVMLAVVLSNQIEGDPLWMFLVSPPGGAKTETLSSLSQCENVCMLSSLTPHSLISGASFSQGDPSLIPKLDGQVLVVKDFTSILSKRDQEKDEIFGILRDAYDGKCAKVFGTGVTRSYKSKFSIMAAVTPTIYEVAVQHQSLGERFLKFLSGDNLRHVSEDDIIRRSIDNINREDTMRGELSDVVSAFLSQQTTDQLPVIPRPYQNQIIALAKFGARMRGTVGREHYRPEIITGRPAAEIGSRLGKQLAKMAVSTAIVNRRKEVTEHEYLLVRKTMLDTIPQRSEDLVRKVWEKCPTIDDTLKTKDIAQATRYPMATISRILADMNILDIMVRTGKANSYEWTLSEYMRKAIKEAKLYAVPMRASTRGTRVAA